MVAIVKVLIEGGTSQILKIHGAKNSKKSLFFWKTLLRFFKNREGKCIQVYLKKEFKNVLQTLHNAAREVRYLVLSSLGILKKVETQYSFEKASPSFGKL